MTPSEDIRARADRAQRVQSLVALGVSATAILVLSISRSLTAQTSSGGAIRDILAGLSIATLGAACVFAMTLIARALSRRTLAKVLDGRAVPLVIEGVRNKDLARAVRDGVDGGHVPLFIALVVDAVGCEVWGGLTSATKVWSASWLEIADVGVGATFDGVQAYECLEFITAKPVAKRIRLIVTGGGFGGLRAIEGPSLEALAKQVASFDRRERRQSGSGRTTS